MNLNNTQCQKYNEYKQCENIASNNTFHYCLNCWQSVGCNVSECKDSKVHNSKYCEGHNYLRISDKIQAHGVAYDLEYFKFLECKTQLSDSSDESGDDLLEDSGIDPPKYKVRTLNIVLGASDYEDEYFRDTWGCLEILEDQNEYIDLLRSKEQMPIMKELEEFLSLYRKEGIKVIDLNLTTRRWIISVNIYEYSSEN